MARAAGETQTMAVEAPGKAAADASQPVTLYSPEGAEYRTSSRREITRLKARGYRDTKPKDAAPAES